MAFRDNRSFNNIRHSNCEKRRAKRRQKRIVLLAMMTVAVLLVVVLAIFSVWSLVDVIAKNAANRNQGTTEKLKLEQILQANSKLCDGTLALVNKNHTFPDNYEFTSLVDIYEERGKVNGSFTYQLTAPNETDNFTPYLQREAFDAFEAMMREHYNIFLDSSLTVTSAYRAYRHQANLAATSGFAPGQSDHHTGLTVALKKYVGEGKTQALPLSHWLYKDLNCAKYGFILRYPGDKGDITGESDYPYCFRYVGIPHALYITQNGLCLEEYTDLLKNYTSDAPLSIRAGETEYLVYYTAASNEQLTTLQVPTNYSYTVSGNNVDGFIVTVDLSAPVTAE